jgi:hypothetical protein
MKHNGWHIVCPDGKMRHPPYTDRAEAEFDAVLAAKNACHFGPNPAFYEEMNGSCPGGEHSVVAGRAGFSPGTTILCDTCRESAGTLPDLELPKDVINAEAHKFGWTVNEDFATCPECIRKRD